MLDELIQGRALVADRHGEHLCAGIFSRILAHENVAPKLPSLEDSRGLREGFAYPRGARYRSGAIPRSPTSSRLPATTRQFPALTESNVSHRFVEPHALSSRLAPAREFAGRTARQRSGVEPGRAGPRFGPRRR